MKNVLEWLEFRSKENSNRIAFTDGRQSVSFGEAEEKAKRIASFILDSNSSYRRPVVLFLDKNCSCIESMLGALYAGGYYVVIDIHSPIDRIERILDTLDDAIIIADSSNSPLAEQLHKAYPVISYEEAIKSSVNHNKISIIRSQMIDSDPAYILFTSGSTGKPKGTVVSHRAIFSYINWVSAEFHFGTDTIFGSQTPLYFSMSVTDFYSTLKCGCTYCIIPKHLFMFPLNLIKFLNDNKVNTIYWVPTAISILSNWKAFEVCKPEYLKTVLFAGEVMPVKQLNYWIHSLDKNILYANLFGSTETTDICTFYVVDRDFADDENLPIGQHCDNCHAFVLTEDGREAQIGQEGELYVRGSFLADGYYNNPEKTKESFVQNPLNKAYPEIVYKTGDLVKYNEHGELLYISRIDFQIKRSGYRIELGEIEAACNSIEGVTACACVYCKERDTLALLYDGGPKDCNVVQSVLAKNVPSYMMPDVIIQTGKFPQNANGKIDRLKLMNSIDEMLAGTN